MKFDRQSRSADAQKMVERRRHTPYLDTNGRKLSKAKQNRVWPERSCQAMLGMSQASLCLIGTELLVQTWEDTSSLSISSLPFVSNTVEILGYINRDGQNEQEWGRPAVSVRAQIWL